MKTGSNVLIIGGAGFIGTYLCRELYNLGHHIRIVDIKSKNSVNPDYDYECLDILDKEGLICAMRGVDIVLHLAAKHRFFGISKKEFFQVNEEGTKNVLEAMDAEGVKKLIFFSTVSVYGESNGPTDENTETRPNSLYGLSKLAAEKWVKNWAERNPEKTAIVLRPTVVFGPHNKGNIYRLIRQIHRRAYIPIGRGDNIKSIAYIENVVHATLFLMNSAIKGLEIYNYADSPHMPYNNIVNLIYFGLGRKAPPYYLPVLPNLKIAKLLDKILNKAGIQFSLETTIHKMNKSTYHRADKIRTLGYAPIFSSEDGLKKTVTWYAEQKLKKRKTGNNA